MHGRTWLGLLALLLAAAPAVAGETVLDGFESLDGWNVVTTGGAQARLALDDGVAGRALRIDYDLTRAGGHVLVRRDMPVPLPADYAIRYRVRALAPALDFELKLIDRGDRNVWWHRQRDVLLPAEWTPVRVKKPGLAFAWGPAGGGAPADIAALEFALTGAEGDRGSVWIDDLRVQARPQAPATLPAPVAAASSAEPHAGAELALDAGAETAWRSAGEAGTEWWQLDLGHGRDYGGLVLDWDADDYPVAYEVQVSDDGTNWTTAHRTTHGNGGRDHVYLPDGESRFMRLRLGTSSRGRGYGLRQATVLPYERAAAANDFFATVARDSPPGTYPKYFAERQTYWTVLGLDGDGEDAALNEEGALEVDRGAFTIEPFLWSDGRLLTWNDVQRTQALLDGELPIPSVTWTAAALGMTVTAFVAGEPGAATLFARYRVTNPGATPIQVTLFLALRPFQVLPPSQTLNMVGGVTRLGGLAFDERTARVDGRWSVIALTPPSAAGAATFDEGPVTDSLLRGEVPRRRSVSDPLGFASGAFGFALSMPAGGARDVVIAVPYDGDAASLAALPPDRAAGLVEERLDATAADWRRRLGPVELLVPGADAVLARTVRSTLAYILINRDGSAIQPGSRTYARSWIRDGAMTSTALLEMGIPGPVREFLPWYARYQLPGGRVPCCVDRHGADPLPEHDSNGEFLYALAEYFRYTRDIGLVHRLWPQAVAALGDLEALRALRLTDAYAGTAFFGLLPESISHEGYAARPVHSYWDDLFALRGLKDVAWLAAAVDDAGAAARAAAQRDGLRRDLVASMRLVMAERGLDYVPASVELGDYDPSSTSIAFEPVGEAEALPAAALRETFRRYAEHLAERRDGRREWDGYAPYELRNVGALVRLGEREAALASLRWLLEGRRPAAWNQWAEIVWRDAATARFIGDMPHTWVGSGFIEAVRTLFAYERESDESLVLAAGVPFAWVTAPQGTGVRRLPTHYGVVSYHLVADGPAAQRLRLSGSLDIPVGGLVLQPPLPRPWRAASIDGRPVAIDAGAPLVVRHLPADVRIEY